MKPYLLVLCLVPAVFCAYTKIPIASCGEGFEDLPCQVNEVLVDECDVVKGKCELERGVKYFMDVKFTPEFEGSDITMIAYANMGGKLYPFDAMNSNACDFMKCPVEKNVQQSYVFNVEIGLSKPRGIFNTLWIMKRGETNLCCFSNKFQIV